MRAELARKQRPRHLCLISHGCRKNDGQSRVNYEIARAALDRGWQVTFLGSYLSADLANAPSLNWIKVARSGLPGNLLKNLLFAVKASILLRRHKGVFDIVHTNGFTVWCAADINTVHFVHSGWINNQFYPYKPIDSRYALYQYSFTLLNSHLERNAFRTSRRLIAVSGKVKEEARSLGMPEEKLDVIHNGVDLDEFHPGPPQRAKFSLIEDVVLFLFAGDIRSRRKNLESVIEALTLVPGVHLAVAGALQASPYPNLAIKRGVADRVHFLGMITDMPGLMRSVDAFVLPSRYEPFGLVLLEALASALPVITAATAGAAELIGDGGVVIQNPDDIQQLAHSMRLLANDAQLRSNMASAARRLTAGLSWSHMTERYFEIYDRC